MTSLAIATFDRTTAIAALEISAARAGLDDAVTIDERPSGMVQRFRSEEAFLTWVVFGLVDETGELSNVLDGMVTVPVLFGTPHRWHAHATFPAPLPVRTPGAELGDAA